MDSINAFFDPYVQSTLNIFWHYRFFAIPAISSVARGGLQATESKFGDLKVSKNSDLWYTLCEPKYIFACNLQKFVDLRK